MFGSRRVSLCNLSSNPRYWYLDIYWNERENSFCSCSEEAAVIEKHSPIVLLKVPKLLREFQSPEYSFPEAPIVWPLLMVLLGLYTIVTLFVSVAVASNGFDIALAALSVVLYILVYIIIRRYRLSLYHKELVEREIRISEKLDEQRDLWMAEHLYPQVGYKGTFIRVFVGLVFDCAPQTTKYILNESQWGKLVIRPPDLQGIQTPTLKPKQEPKRMRQQNQVGLAAAASPRPAANPAPQPQANAARPGSGASQNTNQIQPVAVVLDRPRNRPRAVLA